MIDAFFGSDPVGSLSRVGFVPSAWTNAIVNRVSYQQNLTRKLLQGQRRLSEMAVQATCVRVHLGAMHIDILCNHTSKLPVR